MKVELSKSLFMQDYLFKGSHEQKARKLISEVDNESGARIFSSAVELYIAAAVIGCYYAKRSKKENGDSTLRIMQNQFTNHYNDLMFVYKLVMLKNSDLKLENIDKINNAFRYQDKDENVKVFEEYMLGGIDVLYDRFFVKTNSSYDDFLSSMSSLIADFQNNISDGFDEIDFDSEVEL